MHPTLMLGGAPTPSHVPAARPWVQPQEGRLGPVRVVNLTWLCQSTEIRIIKLKICNTLQRKLIFLPLKYPQTDNKHLRLPTERLG